MCKIDVVCYFGRDKGRGGGDGVSSTMRAVTRFFHYFAIPLKYFYFTRSAWVEVK